MNNPIEGWYPDPDGTPRLRWWNGSDWTENYIADERASNGPVTGSVPPPTTGPIDPITGTIAHATTGHIDRFTGSIARPSRDHCPAPHRRTVHHRYCRSGHRSYRTPGRRTRRTSSCSRCPHSPRRCARATAQEVAQVLRRANHSDPKEPDHHGDHHNAPRHRIQRWPGPDGPDVHVRDQRVQTGSTKLRQCEQ